MTEDDPKFRSGLVLYPAELTVNHCNGGFLYLYNGFWMRADQRWSDKMVSSLNGPVCECSTQILMLVLILNSLGNKFKLQSLNPHGQINQHNT
jgi:hypothetical protein